MEKFDVLVVGSGSGMIIVANASASGMKTAVLEEGPMGGTCLNRGCIPSKMLIYPADVISMISEAEMIGVNATVNSVDFTKMMRRMHEVIDKDSLHQALSVRADTNITWFRKRGTFISDYTMQIENQVIQAERIFIVSGARPGIPPIEGLEKVQFLTSDSVLQLEEQPKSMIIIGGGYVAAEYGHFFSSIGTKVTIIQRNPRLVPEEEPEVSELLRQELSKRMNIYANYEAVEAKESSQGKTVIALSRETGEKLEVQAESLFVAAGRRSNSDILKPEKTGVKLDEKGYIIANEYFETGKRNIWAFGDAIGKQMFKHVANYEADIVWHNVVHDHKVRIDYSATPHAVFSHPQIASVGMKEDEARQKGLKILVGKTQYSSVALGLAMGEPAGFVKVIVEHDTGKILGAHIIGPHASVLIQEIINAMTVEDKTFMPIIRGLHIHPALSEVVQRAFGSLREA